MEKNDCPSIGLWGRNLTDDDNLTFITNFDALVSGTFQEVRTYGIDLIVNFQHRVNVILPMFPVKAGSMGF